MNHFDSTKKEKWEKTKIIKDLINDQEDGNLNVSPDSISLELEIMRIIRGDLNSHIIE